MHFNVKQIKSYFNSQYLSEGVRITIGVLIPGIVLYMLHFSAGFVVSLGALLVSITDGPGPIHHRRNGMAAMVVCLIIICLATGAAVNFPWLLGVLIAFACFFFSMIAVYGSRAASIGVATLVMLTITIDPRHQLHNPSSVFNYTFLVVAGGTWYMFYSLLLSSVTPYRLPRQMLGDLIQQTAAYLKLRAGLYEQHVNYDEAFSKILQQQSLVQQKQAEVSELLLKTRGFVRESTNVGRTLVLIHFDVADIFEKIMMSHVRYSALHETFDGEGILSTFHQMALALADELDEIGLSIKAGQRTQPQRNWDAELDRASGQMDALRTRYLKTSSVDVDALIALRRIFDNITDLIERMQLLHRYTRVGVQAERRIMRRESFEKMVTPQTVDPMLLIDNLNLTSETFRHSLRLTIAVLVGYICGLLFPLGHNYWILLTIVVILKPAYSLTRKRNVDRITGTLIGVFAGVAIVSIVEDSALLLTLVVLLMIGSYSAMRKNYLLSVSLMTPFLVIFYHLLNPAMFTVMLKDRVIDTIVGSGIAWIASISLWPMWEHEKALPVARALLPALKSYFTLVTDSIEGKVTGRVDRHVKRRNVLIALANLQDTFTRMLSEPKVNQEANSIHRFVVLSHALTSYIAGLLQHADNLQKLVSTTDAIMVCHDITSMLDRSLRLLEKEEDTPPLHDKEALRRLHDQSQQIVERRLAELKIGVVNSDTRTSLVTVKSFVDQLKLVYNVAADLVKASKEWSLNIA